MKTRLSKYKPLWTGLPRDQTKYPVLKLDFQFKGVTYIRTSRFGITVDLLNRRRESGIEGFCLTGGSLYRINKITSVWFDTHLIICIPRMSSIHFNHTQIFAFSKKNSLCKLKHSVNLFLIHDTIYKLTKCWQKNLYFITRNIFSKLERNKKKRN